MALFLLVLGAVVIIDALGVTDTASRGPVNARTVPIVVGLLLILMAVLLTVDLVRGGRGEAEGGEDVDLSHGSDWRTIGLLVGSLLCLTAVLLAVDVLRGGVGEAEAGEDVDLASPTDWRTVLLLGGSFLANAALIDRIGWPLSGAVLFFGAAFALGSRSVKRDVPIALAMSFGSYLLVARGLGVGLPAGVFAGVI
jgi:putative tricarboxylic transport membrane protein